MKRGIQLSIFIVFIAIIIASSVKPAIIFFAKKQIKNILPGAVVFIRACDLKDFHQLTLQDVRVSQPPDFDFIARELGIEYTPGSIWQRPILKVFFKDAALDVNLPRENILDLNSHLPQSYAGPVAVQTLEISNLRLNVKSRDVSLQAGVSAEVDLSQAVLRSIDLDLASLQAGNFLLQQGSLKILLPRSPGVLSIQKIQYDKFQANDIRAVVRLKGREVFLASLAGRVLNGEFSGEAGFKLDKAPEYLTKVQFVDLDLDRFTNDFKLKEKFEMSGRLNGHITVSGKGLDMNILDGGFSTEAGGGVLIVKNNEFLEGFARDTQLPLEIVVESLQDYHYNTGTIKFSLDQDDLILDMALDGEAGKRDFNIVLHDFKLIKEDL